MSIFGLSVGDVMLRTPDSFYLIVRTSFSSIIYFCFYYKYLMALIYSFAKKLRIISCIFIKKLIPSEFNKFGF